MVEGDFSFLNYLQEKKKHILLNVPPYLEWHTVNAYLFVIIIRLFVGNDILLSGCNSGRLSDERSLLEIKFPLVRRLKNVASLLQPKMVLTCIIAPTTPHEKQNIIK